MGSSMLEWVTAATDLPPDPSEVGSGDMDECILRVDDATKTLLNSLATCSLGRGLQRLDDLLEVIRRARTWLMHASLTDRTARTELLEADYDPVFAKMESSILSSRPVFTFLSRQELDNCSETGRYAARLLRLMIRFGADLPEGERRRIIEIDAEIAQLSVEYGARLAQETARSEVAVRDLELLKGLSSQARSQAIKAARDRNLPGALITMTPPSLQPAEREVENDELRKRIHDASQARGMSGPHETQSIIHRIADMRRERAALLGLSSHQEWVYLSLDAPPARVASTLHEVININNRALQTENAHLEQRMVAESAGCLTSANRAFYAERYRAPQAEPAGVYRNISAIRTLENGALFAAERYFGLHFSRVDLPHGEVLRYRVEDSEGNHLGELVCDLFSRRGKRGGAWTLPLALRTRESRRTGFVHVCTNFADKGRSSTLSQSEVRTLFHEIGHAVQIFKSDTTYTGWAGTNVPMDVLEFASQVFESFAAAPLVLANYAEDSQSSESVCATALTGSYVRKSVSPAAELGEYLASIAIDIEWHGPHRHGDVSADDVDSVGIARMDIYDAHVAPRYRSRYFSHIWSAGYDGAFHAYLWSEILAANVEDWLRGSPELLLVRATRFATNILARGGDLNVSEAVEDLVGGSIRSAPLLRRRGLISEKEM
ncbi:M3 family metallopeptidase [Curtobacterium flaccumfaciens]|uniref:M3 family metallopeptidase n=1 Tax=Curtobacterium flaccumfaciens TaxID=2035 RepID=UPI001BDDDAF1|nr:M3 family metallopeptidase [Curtobacterium flaccumfaciens]MBT1672842.1 hypothetical protein [Curtobacterium flaccumfaciens pv. flaccumfaciens]